MKAVVFEEFGGPEVLQWKDVPEPKAGPTDVVIRVKAAGLNYNDVWGRRGEPMKVPLPHISGSDASGEVLEVGSEVQHVKVGDEVLVHSGTSCRICQACTRGEEFFCRQYKIWGFQTGPLEGAYAEYARIPAVQAIPKPKNIAWEEAASLGLILQTVWRQLVVRGGVGPGDHVLIWGGAGGLGTIAIQVARLFGAHPIAVASSDEKLARCKELGAEFLINRREQKVPDEVRKIVPAGPDIVFEHVGEATMGDSLRMVRWGGRVVTSGATTGYDAQIDLRHIFFRQASLIGSTMGSKGDLMEGLKHVSSGAIKPVVSQVLPMRELGRAQTIMEEDEAVGKLVLVP